MRNYMLASLEPRWCNGIINRVNRISKLLYLLQYGENHPESLWDKTARLLRDLGDYLLAQTWDKIQELGPHGKPRAESQVEEITEIWQEIDDQVPYDWQGIDIRQRQRDVSFIRERIDALMDTFQFTPNHPLRRF
jgi:hypothetical protein